MPFYLACLPREIAPCFVGDRRRELKNFHRRLMLAATCAPCLILCVYKCHPPCRSHLPQPPTPQSLACVGAQTYKYICTQRTRTLQYLSSDFRAFKAAFSFLESVGRPDSSTPSLLPPPLHASGSGGGRGFGATHPGVRWHHPAAAAVAHGGGGQ